MKGTNLYPYMHAENVLQILFLMSGTDKCTVQACLQSGHTLRRLSYFSS